MITRRVGTTSQEVENITNMDHTTVSARRCELRAAGYTDYLYNGMSRVRRPTLSGKSAYVEIATAMGKAAIKNGTPLKLNGHDPTRRLHKGNPMSSAAFASSDFTTAAWLVLKCMCAFTPDDE